MTAAELADVLRRALPSTSGDVRMECVDVRREPGAGLGADVTVAAT